MILTTPLNKPISVDENGEIHGDYEDLAGWVRSGSHRDQDVYMRWYLFLKEWERQQLREKICRRHDVGWQDLVETLLKKP
jgi:hypothetical protein